MPIIDHKNRKKKTCNDDKLLLLMSTHSYNHKKKRKRKRKRKRKEESILNDTVQMDLFICLTYMSDSSTGAVNEKETETEH